MDDLESLTNKLYESLGIKNDLFDTTTATGIEARETYYRLFGHYPEAEYLQQILTTKNPLINTEK